LRWDEDADRVHRSGRNLPHPEAHRRRVRDAGWPPSGPVPHPCQQGTLAIAAVAEGLLITIGESLHNFARTGVELRLFPGPAGVPGRRRAPPSARLESLVSGS
jgi:hypothetical protein